MRLLSGNLSRFSSTKRPRAGRGTDLADASCGLLNNCKAPHEALLPLGDEFTALWERETRKHACESRAAWAECKKRGTSLPHHTPKYG